MLSGNTLDVTGLTADGLECRITAIDVAGVSIQFAETRLPSAQFGDARLLVGQSDATTVALVSSDGLIKLALREATPSDLDEWLQG
jgi:hypothetical protein